MSENSKNSNSSQKNGNSQPQKRPVDVASIVTSRFIEQLEKGIIPWRVSWSIAGQPKNLVTKFPYRGINVWLLAMLGFQRNFFITSKQLKELGGVGREEQKGAPVTFWNWKEVTDDDGGEIKNVPFLRYYYVLNIDQCDGIPDEHIPAPPVKDKNPIKRCEELLADMPHAPEVKFKEKKAHYDPCLDVINIPKMEKFESSEAYYDMLLHQLVHSTGHVSRLGRKELMLMPESWAEGQHSVEELIAEMGACHLRSLCGFTGSDMKKADESVAKAWLEKIKSDKNMLIYAGAKTQQAVDYILNVERQQKTGEPVAVTEAATADKDDKPY